MASVKIKNVKRITEKIESALNDIMLRDELLSDIANFSVDRIKQKARLSKRMEDGGSDSESLPRLSKGYIEKRKGIGPGENGTDSKFFLPNVKVSQLTFTGQLLGSLSGKIIKKGKSKSTLELSFKGTRKDKKTNSGLYKELLERDSGYKILALSKKAVDIIRNKVLTRLRQELIKRKLK